MLHIILEDENKNSLESTRYTHVSDFPVFVSDNLGIDFESYMAANRDRRKKVNRDEFLELALKIRDGIIALESGFYRTYMNPEIFDFSIPHEDLGDEYAKVELGVTAYKERNIQPPTKETFLSQAEELLFIAVQYSKMPKTKLIFFHGHP